jgi:hypothetical protein
MIKLEYKNDYFYSFALDLLMLKRPPTTASRSFVGAKGFARTSRPFHEMLMEIGASGFQHGPR